MHQLLLPPQIKRLDPEHRMCLLPRHCDLYKFFDLKPLHQSQSASRTVEMLLTAAMDALAHRAASHSKFRLHGAVYRVLPTEIGKTALSCWDGHGRCSRKQHTTTLAARQKRSARAAARQTSAAPAKSLRSSAARALCMRRSASTRRGEWQQ